MLLIGSFNFIRIILTIIIIIIIISEYILRRKINLILCNYNSAQPPAEHATDIIQKPADSA